MNKIKPVPLTPFKWRPYFRNSLRYMLIKEKDVDFCGYSIPHPSENNMNLRL